MEIRFHEATGEHGFLSNLFPRGIVLEGRAFRSAEDAYQYGKPKDPAVADWLVSAPKPHLCATAAHALLPYDIRPDWNNTKVQRMRDVLRAKFTQHADLRRRLLATAGAVLTEDSRTDAFWGVGKAGKGKNMLGVLLMELRSDLGRSP